MENELEQQDPLIAQDTFADDIFNQMNQKSDEQEPEIVEKPIESDEKDEAEEVETPEKSEDDKTEEEAEEEISDVLQWEGEEYTAEQIGEFIELSKSERFKMFKELPDEAFDKVTNQVTALKVAEERNVEAKKTLEEAKKLRSVYDESLEAIRAEDYGIDKKVFDDLETDYPEVFDLVKEMHQTIKTIENESQTVVKQAEKARVDAIVNTVTRSIPKFKGMSGDQLVSILKDPDHDMYFDVMNLDTAIKTSNNPDQVLAKLEKYYGKVEAETKTKIKKDQQEALRKQSKNGFKKIASNKANPNNNKAKNPNKITDLYDSEDPAKDVIMGRRPS